MFWKQESILQKHNKLVDEILYRNFFEYDTFIHAQSVLDDPWYNFLIPKVNSSKLNQDKVNEVIKTEKDRGLSLAYYIHESLYEDYKNYLPQKDYVADDTFISVTLDKPFNIIGQEIVELTEEYFEEYIKLTKECFPDWENEEKYSKLIFNLGDKVENRRLKTHLILEDGEIAAFGSVIIDPDQNLAYLHNAGTRKQSRNKGYFSSIIKEECNIALKAGVREIYGLAEDGTSSHRILTKMGFETKDVFHLFLTE